MTDHHLNALPKAYRLEEYELVRVLGSGGFGITYLGYDHNLDKGVAIKEYLPSDIAARTAGHSVAPQTAEFQADFNWGLERFLDEARTLARFTHPNIIQVHRFFEAHGTAYIVMEYAEGETLAELLKRRGTLAEAELQAILLPLLSGLAAVHEAGILHRDIKPGNIMLRATDGSPVLVDFGAARQAVGARSRSMTAIVTPGYAPIEQYSSRGRQGPWTDMYALGGVCYRALAGELPAEATDRVRVDPLIPITEAGRDKAGEAFLLAVDWALRVDEGARPQEVGEWRAALLGEREVPAAVSTQAEGGTGRSSAARSGLFMWTLGLALALLVGMASWWGWQSYRHGSNLFEAVKAMLPALEEAGPEAPAEVETMTVAVGELETETPTETGTETQVAIAEQEPPADAAQESTPSVSTDTESKSAPTSPVKEDDVTRLLAAAEADLKARRLTSPAGNNAWERYQRVLELAPAHPEAMAGMEQVIESYMALFGPALEQEEFDKASDYLERIRGLHPDSPVLEEGERRLKGAKQAQAKRLAENQAIREHLDSFEAALEAEDFDEAADFLERVRALHVDAPELAEGERRLEEARQAQADRLAELARQRQAEAVRQAELFEEALREGEFDRAAGHLERVRELHPEAPVLVEGERRLAEARQTERMARAIEAHWAAFEAALEAEDFDRAADSLVEVRGLDPEASGLAEGEERLDVARQAAETRRALAGEMVAIPGGTFRMGDLSGEGDNHEKPVHNVTVPAFRLGKYEVTVGQFRNFVQETEYRTDAERNAGDRQGCLTRVSGFWMDKWEYVPGRSWRDPGYTIGDDQPVVCVSWDDVQTFIDWLNNRTDGSYRLSTEAEWEYAARAGSETRYYFGNAETQLCDYANVADTTKLPGNRVWYNNADCNDGAVFPAKAGSYRPNAFGLYDMHGNVWEWVQDCWHDSYQGAPSDGSAWTSGECGRRVVRGGSWGFTPRDVRSASRDGGDASGRNDYVGFRLVRVVQDY